MGGTALRFGVLWRWSQGRSFVVRPTLGWRSKRLWRFFRGAWIGVRSCGFCGVVFWPFVVRSGRWPSHFLVGPFPRTLPWAFVVRTFGAWE
jgi:hypothetical protein